MLEPFPKVSIPIAFIANYYSPALIVDNDITTQCVLPNQLRKFGFRGTESAFNGEKARICLATRPRLGLIILDLSMPQLDGIAVIKDIARFHPCSSIILLSSLDENLLRTARRLAESYGLRVLAAHEKPLEREKLLELLSDGFCARKIEIRENYEVARTFQPSKAIILSSLPSIDLYFQPKICLLTSEIIGCEALARLILDFGGAPRVLPPDYFIPYFEKEKKMTELTTLVVRKSLDSLKYFLEEKININMSINLSMHDMASSSLHDFLEAETRARSISPEQVTLEVTETSFSQNMNASMETARRLRLLGFSVSIDDFGAGLSDIKHLRQLPFDELKIDRAVVRGAVNDRKAFTILETSVDLAKSHKLKVVAKGIESEVERNLVSDLGGEIGQGFLFCRAEPKEKIVDWYFDAARYS